jgi:hypothetical protein
VVWKAAKDELDMLEFDVKHVPATGQQCLFESSEVITEDSPYAVTFLKAGAYEFECTVYGMQGTVVVASAKALIPKYLLAKVEPEKPTVYDLYGRWQQWMEVYVSETEDLTGRLATEAFDRNAQLLRPVWLNSCLSCGAELPVEGSLVLIAELLRLPALQLLDVHLIEYIVSFASTIEVWCYCFDALLTAHPCSRFIFSLHPVHLQLSI